jgi:RimJ/RimL family protein N-acetyltransferase
MAAEAIGRRPRARDIVTGVTPSNEAPTIVPADLAAHLSGRHVTVEPLAPEHVDGLIEAATDAEMFRWMGVDLSQPETLRAWVTTALDAARRGAEVPFAIRAADTGTVLGTTRFLSLQLEHLAAEIGWTWVARSTWGTGVNVETKLLLLSHGFETVGLRRIEFKTDARNERSRGALTALGAVYEGTFRKHRVLPGGGVRDSAYFSIIDDEWPAVKTRLRERLVPLGAQAARAMHARTCIGS